VGTNAAKIALGMGAKVTLIDLNLNRLRELDDIFNGRVFTLASNSYNLALTTREADLVIGGVLIPGAAAPKIVTAAMVAKMKKGAVIVDVAIDQGGCIETAKPTTHSNPLYDSERGGALLRDKYAGGCAEYFNARPYQRDLPLCDEDCAARGKAGHPVRQRHGRRCQYLCRHTDLSGGRAVAKQAISADPRRACLIRCDTSQLEGRGRDRALLIAGADSGYWRTVMGSGC